MSISRILSADGATLAVLVLLSVYSLALMWERRAYHKRAMGRLQPFLAKLRQLMKSGAPKEAAALCRELPGAGADVVMSCLVGPTSKRERRSAADRELERQVARLEKGLPTLGTIGSTAPFIGLFGTVLGVMRAFSDLAKAENAGPGVVAVGISNALIATAAGLFVAIPAIIAYNYFTTKANHFSDELRWATDEVLDWLTEGSSEHKT
ncbi:MAG: MotA/TolQ/ExbB proton channel family protein [Elusimicrobiota bacterium]